ncbi:MULTISPECIES: TonB-dependent receptor domain-containing protein [unclassified Cobetia]|uniref:TonB-dependent receptor domain-containing protein n=1 Tax=unclassified Cobetia TaxID=2609414 RepID=UPI002097473F|nr:MULTISPECIES: TonB-dependent receptor [unclassified Cobetia]MCO7233226.1 TonB-dependent receptor [Cobetia sp. Dlab-2-AX]MCO7236500.1 TonB-dependent receptor [Cobetia sp. Dlab-2-U]
MALATLPSLVALPSHASDQLEDIVVTASGHDQMVKDAPASMSVITRESLEGRHYSDLTDALRGLPGVTVSSGGYSKDISIRGMPGEYTLILVDGRPIDSRDTRPSGSGGFEQDWLPSLEAIERIEVVRGPMSTRYGSDAIGGVINIITRKTQEEWVTNLHYDTFIPQHSVSGHERQSRIRTSGPLIDGLLGLSVSAGQTTRQEDDITRGYPQRKRQDLDTKLSLTPDDNQRIEAEFAYHDQNRQTEEGRSQGQDSDRDWDTRRFSLSHQGDWASASTNSYVQYETSRNDSRDITLNNTKASSNALIPLGDHLTTLGVSFEEEHLEDNDTNALSDINEIRNSRWSLFAEDEWLLTDDWALTGGVRLDEDENYGSHLSPRLYSVYQLADNWTLKTGVATGYKAPSLRQVADNWVQDSRGGDIYGNPGLEAETSLSREIGLLYDNARGTQAGVTLFRSDFDDKIVTELCPDGACAGGADDARWYNNVDSAVTQGVELSLNQELSHDLALALSYTYTDSEQTSGENKGQPLTQIPRHQATAQLDWQLNHRLNHWTRVDWRGEETQPATGVTSRTVIAPSYTIVDTGVSFDATTQLTLSAGLYNLFDKRVRYDDFGYVEDGRRLWVGVDYTL